MAGKAEQVEFLISGLHDTDGTVLNAGRVYFFEQSTTTNKTIWADRDKSVAATTSTDVLGKLYVLLGSDGNAFDVYADGIYTVRIDDSTGSTIDTIDMSFNGDKASISAGTSLNSYYADNGSSYVNILTYAIDDIGGAETTLLMDVASTLTVGDTVPANITLKFLRNSVVTITAGQTLTVDGTIEAGEFQIFACTTATFDDIVAYSTGEANAEWFADFADAVDGLAKTNSDPTNLTVSAAHTMDRAVTIPLTMRLRFLRDGVVTLGNFALTINGQLEAGMWQIFNENGSGVTSFGAQSVEAVYAEWWGAKGDNSNADHGALVDAIRSADNRKLILLPESIYLIGSTLTLTTNSNPTVIEAYGATIKKNWDDGADASDTMIRLGTCDWKVFGLELDGNSKTAGLGINLQDDLTLKDVLIQNCYIHDTGGSAIGTLAGTKKSFKSLRILNNKCETNGNGGSAVAPFTSTMRIVNVDNVLIQGNYIKDSEKGIDLAATDLAGTNTNFFVQILDNKIQDINSATTGIGIGVGHTRDLIISGNVINDAEDNAIDVNSCMDVTINSNNCSSSKRGVFVGHGSGAPIYCRNIVVSGNTVRGSTTEGMEFLEGIDGLVCTGNSIDTSTTDGIKTNPIGNIPGEDILQRFIISNNHIFASTQHGINLGGTQDCVISGNLIHTTGFDGIHGNDEATTVDYYVITGNYIVGNSTGNGTTYGGINMEAGADNGIIRNNYLLNSTGIGIELGGPGWGKLDNTISGSYTTAYSVSSGSNYYINSDATTATGSVAVDVVAEVTKLDTTGGGTMTLADGTQNQRKILIMSVDSGTDAVVTPTNLATTATTITFNDVGESAELMFLNSSWHVIGVQGAVVS